MYRKTWDIVKQVGKCVNKIIKIYMSQLLNRKTTDGWV